MNILKEQPKINPFIERAMLVHKRNGMNLEAYQNLIPNLSEDPIEALDQVMALSKGCKDCILSTTRNNVIGVDGVYGAPIMIILEGPGQLEDLSVLPLVGHQEIKSSVCNNCSKLFACYDSRISFGYRRAMGTKRQIVCNPSLVNKEQLHGKFNLYSSGAVFDGILLKKYGYNFPRENWRQYYKKQESQEFPYLSPWFITNSILCRAWDVDTNSDTTAPNLAVKTCKKWLALQYAILQPKIIICVGKVSLSNLMGDKFRCDVGEKFESKWGPVIYTPHPASVMREKNIYRQGIYHSIFGKALDKALFYCGLLEGDQIKPITAYE